VAEPIGYLARGTSTQYNVTQVVAGQHEDVIEGDDWELLDHLNSPFTGGG
jgi:hypothetical protein